MILVKCLDKDRWTAKQYFTFNCVVVFKKILNGWPNQCRTVTHIEPKSGGHFVLLGDGIG